MIFNQLIEIYKKLKDEGNKADGLYERRLNLTSPVPVYLGLELPSNLISISISIPEEMLKLLHLECSNGIELSIHRNTDRKEVRLLIKLSDKKFYDLFLILSSDLIQVLSESVEIKTAVSNFDNRLDYWRKFLKESHSNAISKEELKGLIGELIVLKELLSISSDEPILLGWKGPLGSRHDFAFQSDSIEVKTSTAKSKHLVNISSEHQLDYVSDETLYLTHVLLEESDNGDSLSSLIYEIMSLLDPNMKQAFTGLLSCVGCHVEDLSKLDSFVFKMTNLTTYLVCEDFPRIARSQLKENVINVHYKLSLSGLESNRVDTAQLFMRLTNANLG